MRRVNAGFVSGFLLTVAAFVLVNGWTYSAARAEFEASTIRFSHTGYYWGFPLRWIYEGTCFPCDVFSLMSTLGYFLNLLICIAAAVGVGFFLNRIVEKRRLD